MNKFSLIFFISILFFNCKNEQSEYESYTSIGEIEHASFTFCAIVPSEVDYSYRVGEWIFKSTNSYKLAKGKYGISVVNIDSIGGCNYEIITNTISLKEWVFWNEKGEIIEPTKRMINLVQPNQMNSVNPFEQNQ
ncbi:hypothetical protein ITJ86_07245 [Winogradskyella sp. F6397]|uniref:DUF3997 domain-containing protein n=1 Tax=Winogradskyella marina TaxID=2785530 RepID=A0ABS0EGW9_9FLAO|nr:hypothetical protein [Winogradskyella marina]MBF8149689.1 hypothetical protein [Winogradskyella marina]